eukprot:TRINITY_DN888_c0_g1_i1.p1 TRINITY_DN888_c0_g1~~TRINITY_DN888_c0_g1_i1.p1  ORF type:complete len:509 (-),score=46.25 TRINITY_DN888_c0_g1_i1:31-1557(-)
MNHHKNNSTTLGQKKAMENANQPVKYVVSSKDTIAGIALKFGIPLAQFKQINRLHTGAQLFPGQEVLVFAKAPTETKQEVKSQTENADPKQHWSPDLGMPLLSALREKFRSHYVDDPTSIGPVLPSLSLGYKDGFRARFNSADLGVSERDVYSESTWFVINKVTAVLGRLIIGMGRIIFEVPLESQDVVRFGLLACSFACFIEDVEGATISPLTSSQRASLSIPDTITENYVLQIKTKDRSHFTSSSETHSDNFISEDGEKSSDGGHHLLEAESGYTLSYFLLNENNIRSLFQVLSSHICPTRCRMRLIEEEEADKQSSPDPSPPEVTSMVTPGSPISFVPKTDYVSSILTKRNRKLLGSWLPQRLRFTNWKLLYSTHYHGISLNTFYNNTEDMGANIIVMRTAKSRIFGGYASESWTRRTGFYGSGESFLFQIQPDPHVYYWTEKNTYFMHSSDDGIAMGGERGRFGVWVDAEFHHGTSAPCITFDNDRLSDTDQFEVIFFECWGFD